jgi:hypothetical protein
LNSRSRDPWREREGQPAFERYIGIDYSGAATPVSSLMGLRVYLRERAPSPVEVESPRSPRKYWSRRGIAEWLIERLSADQPTLVGADHRFLFPLRYFEAHRLPPDWPVFLDDIQRHWATDEAHTHVDFVRPVTHDNGPARSGNIRWRWLTEIRAGSAKSVHFDVQDPVAKSTHAGLPRLRYVRQKVGARVHFWPFDGADIPGGRSAIVEVYPALSSHGLPCEARNAHQHDAYSVVAWMRGADISGWLRRCFDPVPDREERGVANVEGWILGVGTSP